MDQILISPAITTSDYKHRFVLKVNKKNTLKSVLCVEQQYKSGKWGGTPGGWCVGTLLNKEGFYGSNDIGDKIFIDGGQNWFVTGLIEALKEVKSILNID